MGKGRQYQDSLFRMYFNDEMRLRELAGALHGKAYAAEERLEIVTLEGTFLSQIKNDVSFLLAGRYLIFLEHQSTPNENMPLRCLYYVCEQLRKSIDSKQIYMNQRITLPVPEFHVFYTGGANTPEEYEMKLSDAYAEASNAVNLELKVCVHNVAYDEAKLLLGRSAAMRDYAMFIQYVKVNMARGMEREAAIREAVRYCIEHDVMKDFLIEHEREVIDMVAFEWNQKLFEEAKFEEGLERGREQGLEQGLERGREQGLEQGLEQGRVFAVLGMLKEKLPLEMISRVSEMSVEKIREIGRMHSLL